VSEFVLALGTALVTALLADLNYFETAVLVALLFYSYRRTQRYPQISKAFDKLARRRALAIPGVIAATLLGRLALLPCVSVPAPLVPDEFSHRLLGETLSIGRLTNPAHPLWRHFESIHIIPQPSYASMYFPMQGIFLAVGFLLGHPWIGIWLSTGLMCGAICWMMYTWLPPRWALLGGLLAVLRLGLLSYWMNSYWGGAHAALGGALVLGAIGRLRRRFDWISAAALGIGMSVLLLGRPLEGGVLCTAALVYLTVQLKPLRVLRRAAPALVVLTIAGGFLALYCLRVTGSPTTVPYQINQRLYGWPMTLITYSPPGIHTEHPQLQQYYDWEIGEHNKLRYSFFSYTVERLGLLWRFYVGPLLSVALLGFWRVRRTRPLCWIAGLILALVMLEESGYPHYLAPACSAVLVLLVQGLRVFRLYRPGSSPMGRTFVRHLPGLLVALVVLRAAGLPTLPVVQHKNYTSWCCTLPGHYDRESLEARLRQAGSTHVILVRYHEQQFSTKEWVYNHPDIDRAAVIWARDMGAQNAELKARYPQRHFWLAEPDEMPLRVTDCQQTPQTCGLLP